MIDLPALYCPIPSAVSPHGEAAEREVVDWLEKFQLATSPAQAAYFARSRFPLFPALSLPCAHASLLPLAGKEVMWLQSFDDVYCDEKPGGTPLEDLVVLLAKLARIMDDPSAALLTDNPWAEALRDLRLSVGEAATPAQCGRWVTAMNAYFEGLLWETVQRNEGRRQRVDDYVAMWLKQSGVHPCTVFTDIVCGYEVPASEWSSPAAQALRDMTAAVIGWDNDLTSLEKETHRAAKRGLPAVQNLVAVLAADGGRSTSEAVGLCAAMRDHAMAQFLRLRDATATTGSPELTRYAHGLGQWIRGYLDYARESPRYTDPCNPDDSTVTVDLANEWEITDRPPAIHVPLPDLPSISWWSCK